MINMFAACKVEELWRNPEFRLLIATSGDFVITLIGEMFNRLSPETKSKERSYSTTRALYLPTSLKVDGIDGLFIEPEVELFVEPEVE